MHVGTRSISSRGDSYAQHLLQMYARLLAVQKDQVLGKEIVISSIVDKNVTFLGFGFLTVGELVNI